MWVEKQDRSPGQQIESVNKCGIRLIDNLIIVQAYVQKRTINAEYRGKKEAQ